MFVIIYISSFLRCTFKHFANFIFVLLLNYRGPPCIVDSNSLSEICIVEIFSQCVVCLFTFLAASFQYQKILILIKPNLTSFFFGLCFLCSKVYLRLWRFSSKNSSRNVCFGFYFRSVISFKIYRLWDKGQHYFFSKWISNCFSTVCWKDYFSSLSYLGTFVKQSIYVGLILESLVCFIGLHVTPFHQYHTILITVVYSTSWNQVL